MPSDIQAQIERRRQRAQEEIVRVTNTGNHPVFSSFDVKSVSGQAYRVDIESLDELHNTCTCPDYASNLIGTCKHIEGVLLHLNRTHGRRLPALARQRPRGARIYLHHGQEVTARVSLPPAARGDAQSDAQSDGFNAVRDLLARHFDPGGALVGAPLDTLPVLFAALDHLPAPERALARVDEAVRRHLDLLRDREEARRQRAWFTDQVQRGNRTFDVLTARLYPYQEAGAMHLAFGRRALLADDMGLGKTVQAIAAAALLRELRGIQRALVVCPASLKHQWQREIRRFTALPAVVVQGGLKERRAGYADPAFFTIVNYELVRHDQDELRNLRPDLIILDEAQRIKNWRTKTAAMVKQLRSPYAFVLTGTPLENRIDELYSIFQFLEPRVLGPLWHFNDRFYELEPRPSGGVKVLGYRNLDVLRAEIAPHVLRRTRQEVLRDLPPRVDNNFFVEMTDPQWKAYEQFSETLAKLAAKAQRLPLSPKEREIMLMCLVKMRLICNALALHDRDIPVKDREKTSPKLRELEHILNDEIATDGRKAILFSQWSDMLALTEPIVKRVGLGYVKLTGDVPTHKRGALIERFFNDPDCKVFLSTDAGGVGLNLQAASVVVNLEIPWNPAVLEQRIGRAHRHGQAQSVQVINLVAKGTIEERMLDRLAAKRSVFAGVFGADEDTKSIRFEDTGQGLLTQLSELLGEPVTAQVDLAPAQPVPAPAAPPTLRGFAELLHARLPGRVLIARPAPGRSGVLIVTTGAPAELRLAIQALLAEHYPADPPALHLMDPEGYRALCAFLPAEAADQEDVYTAPASTLPSGPSPEQLLQERRKQAQAGLAAADKKLALADLLRQSGYLEEMLAPARAALGWGLSSLLALYRPGEPGADPPSPRLVQTELIDPGRLPDDLALQLARVDALAAPPAADTASPAPPLSAAAAGKMLDALRALVDLARQRVISAAL